VCGGRGVPRLGLNFEGGRTLGVLLHRNYVVQSPKPHPFDRETVRVEGQHELAKRRGKGDDGDAIIAQGRRLTGDDLLETAVDARG